MDMINFYDKVKQAKEEDCKVICFIRPKTYSGYHLYFVRDILDPNISLDDYDYEEVKGVEYVSIELKDDKFKQTMVGIDPKSLSQIIRDPVIVDFDNDSKKIIERFILYMNYFLQASSSNSVDLQVFLYLYAESVYTQRQISKQLGVSINFLYNQTSINEIRPLKKRATLLKCESLKYKYIGMVYVNVYTFDVYLQLHYRPNIDTLLTGITEPVLGNLLVGIFPTDSSEQVMSQFINFQSDLTKIITVHTDKKVDSR